MDPCLTLLRRLRPFSSCLPLLFLLLLAPGLGGAETAVTPEPVDLARLRQEYLRRRAEALRPVTARYQTELEALLHRLTQTADLSGALLVKKELETAREAAAQELNADLRKALLETKWSWSDQAGEKGVAMTFSEDGTVSHIGMRGTWQITGARELLLIEAGWKRRTLRFDAALGSYEEVNGPIRGKRWK